MASPHGIKTLLSVVYDFTKLLIKDIHHGELWRGGIYLLAHCKNIYVVSKNEIRENIALPILIVSRTLSLRCPYAFVVRNMDLKFDVALQHCLSGMCLLLFLHINCPDVAPLQVFRKCQSLYALCTVVRLAAAFMEGHVYSECVLAFSRCSS